MLPWWKDPVIAAGVAPRAMVVARVWQPSGSTVGKNQRLVPTFTFGGWTCSCNFRHGRKALEEEMLDPNL